MLIEYHFKIKHIKGINNARADILSRKTKLQSGEKPSDTILRLNKDRRIRYNHLQLVGTHKVLKSLWEE